MPRPVDEPSGRGGAISHRAFLGIAVPFILSTITQPLLGAVDTAVVGHLPDPSLIGGVAVGTVIFNTLYWLFGFLRVGTTGLSAQARGMNDPRAELHALARPALIAAAIGVGITILQTPIFNLTMRWMSPSAEVLHYTGVYYRVLIWGAPLVLLNYVVLGWLMGQARIRASLFMQIGGNLLNIVLDIVFVFYFGMGVGGVAAATLLSQIFSFVVGVAAVAAMRPFPALDRKSLFDRRAFAALLGDNANLMLRTVCLLIQINVFTATGSSFGTVTLSANAILFQIMMLISYSLDGLANTASVFSGKAVGGRDRAMLGETWRMTAFWAVALTLFSLLLFATLDRRIVDAFTNIGEVRAAIWTYANWVYLFPVAASAGVCFYGIFTGTGATGPVRNSTFFALVLYLACWRVCVPLWGNHGLWLAFISFYLGRSVFLLPYYKKTYTVFRETNRDAEPAKGLST